MTTLDTSLAILGGMTARTFLSDYWQQKPLVIRAGLTDFELPLEADELAGLAMEEEVESRIVIEQGQQPWELRQGPFQEADFASLPAQEWTLLVQAVDHWVPEIQALKERFHFLPSWRLDDVMVSYATQGGSVGPHYDQYDVFLVQVSGQRRWQILPPEQYDDSAMANSELHILQNFQADPALEWDLNAGDILYLPPNYAHNGRALDDDCMTYSVGFRAPSLQDALTGLHDNLIENIDEKRRFAAPATLKEGHHAAISQADITYLHAQLTQLIDQPERLMDWLGNTMSDVKYPEYQIPLSKAEAEAAFAQAQAGQTFFRPGDARICYTIAAQADNSLQLFCNGESIKVSAELETFVQAICDEVEFDFSGLDMHQHADIIPLIQFLISKQGLVELTANQD